MDRGVFDPGRVPVGGGNGQAVPPELDELAHRVIGAAIEVHRELGPGLLESAYEQALAIELRSCGIPFEMQVPVEVLYKAELVGHVRLDCLVDGRLLLELKSVDQLAPIHTAQIISYLRASKLRLGLLINFNVRVLEDGIKRIIV